MNRQRQKEEDEFTYQCLVKMFSAGWTPLHEACFNGWLEIAATLVDAGANINARGYDNDTPLHDAAISGKLNLVKYLLSVGADPFCKNINGKLPFDVARPPAHSYLACITGM